MVKEDLSALEGLMQPMRRQSPDRGGVGTGWTGPAPADWLGWGLGPSLPRIEELAMSQGLVLGPSRSHD